MKGYDTKFNTKCVYTNDDSKVKVSLFTTRLASLSCYMC
jgi:hypothetical protein